MSEMNEPFLEAKIGSEVVPISRNNLTLYQHLGSRSLFDHCCIEVPNNPYKLYIWRGIPAYEILARLAEEHGAQITLNIPEPLEAIVQLYVKHHTQDLKVANPGQIKWSNNE